MGARELLDDLAGAGVRVQAQGDRLLIQPAGVITDAQRADLRAYKPELLALLSGVSPATERPCADCTHRLAPGTCGRPIAAGLVQAGAGFGIRWAPEDFAATCPAFTPKPPAKASDRPHRPSQTVADAGHAEAWDSGATTRFLGRAERLRRHGFTELIADDLAERLHLRDLESDDRRLCVECNYLSGHTSTGWRCGNSRAAGMARELPPDLVVLPMRCAGFLLAGK